MRPESMISELRVASFGEYSIVKNKVTFGQSEFDHEWLNSTKIKLTPKNLPSSSLWDQEGCEGIVESGERKEKVRFQNHKQYEFSVSQFHPVKVTCESNGFTKVFDFFQPFKNVKFTNMHKPVIRITNSKERGKIPFSFQLSSGDKILRKKEKFGTPSAKNSVVDDIPIPLEWYRNLESEGILTFDIWTDNGSYEDSFDIEVSPPELSFFRPKPVNVKTIVSATEGYVVEFELEPLSPKMNNFDGEFIQDNGRKTSFSVVEGKVRMIIPYSFDKNKTLTEVHGRISADQYYKKDGLLKFDFSFSDYVTVRYPDSFTRDCEEDIIEIYPTEHFAGSATLRLQVDENNLEKWKSKIGKNDSFDFSIDSETIFTASQIREEISLIDHHFLENFPEKIPLELVLRPFDNQDKFGQHVLQFDILRDIYFVEAITEPTYVSKEKTFRFMEGEDTQICKFKFSELYFQDKDRFTLDYSGVRYAHSSNDNDSEVSFIVKSPDYSALYDNAKWVLSYNDKEVLQGEVVISKITFKPHDEIIDIFNSLHEKLLFMYTDMIGVFHSEGQNKVKVEISVNLKQMEEQVVSCSLREVKNLEFSSLKHIFSKYHDFILHELGFGLVGNIEVKIPSRNITLAKLPIRLRNDHSLPEKCQEWIRGKWEPKNLEEFEKLERIPKSITCYLICLDLKKFFESISDYHHSVWFKLVKNQNRGSALQLQKALSRTAPRLVGLLEGYDSEIIKSAIEWRDWYENNKGCLNDQKLKEQVNFFSFQAEKLIKEGPPHGHNNFVGSSIGQYISWLEQKIRGFGSPKIKQYFQLELEKYQPPEPSSNPISEVLDLVPSSKPTSEVQEPVTENSSEVKEGVTRTVNETVRESVGNIKKSNDTVKETARRNPERKGPHSNSRKPNPYLQSRESHEKIKNRKSGMPWQSKPNKEGKELTRSPKKAKNVSKPLFQPKKKNVTPEPNLTEEEYKRNKRKKFSDWTKADKNLPPKRAKGVYQKYENYVKTFGPRFGDDDI